MIAWPRRGWDMRTKTLFSVSLLFLSALSPLARAADADGPLPLVDGFMSCQGRCADFVPAKPVSQEMPRISNTSISESRRSSDGFVKVLYTVGPDGRVRDDVLVVNLIGSRDFADKVVEKVRTWRFKPATSNGKPVAQSQTQQLLMNVASGPFPILPRIEVIRAQKDIPVLIAQGKTEEARAELEDVLRNVPLSFSERTAIASPLADMAFDRGDYMEARRLAVIANLSVPTGSGNAWLTRIKADLMLGNVSDALYSFAVQRYTPAFALPDLMQKARATADAAPLLTMQAQIPVAEEGDAYAFIPYRRTFTFQKIQGSLQKFTLSCRQATMESDITPTSQWRIPSSWNGCSVYVRGTPGTRFLVVQPKE
jgi:TonB family protein